MRSTSAVTQSVSSLTWNVSSAANHVDPKARWPRSHPNTKSSPWSVSTSQSRRPSLQPLPLPPPNFLPTEPIAPRLHIMQGAAMPAFLLFLAMIQAEATPETRVHGTIEAAIQGTNQPLDVVLLVRDGESWKEVDRRALAASSRVTRFDRLASGVYQVLVSGSSSTEQLATKVMIGSDDTRRTVIAIDPLTVIGRVTLGGGELGPGVISLRHKEFRWRASVKIAPDGTFRIPLWQRGTYACSVRAAAITMSYAGMIEI